MVEMMLRQIQGRPRDPTPASPSPGYLSFDFAPNAKPVSFTLKFSIGLQFGVTHFWLPHSARAMFSATNVYLAVSQDRTPADVLEIRFRNPPPGALFHNEGLRRF